MINIDRYVYASKLKQKNPQEKLFFALLTLIVCLCANSILVSVAVLLIMSWVSVYKGGIPVTIFLKLMVIPLTFLILGVLTIAIEINGDPEEMIISLTLFGNLFGITKSGVFTALKLLFRALGAVSCLYYLALNTPMVDLISALKKLRFPNLLVELMSLIYRYIFVLMDTAETIYRAQISRLGYVGLASGYRSMGALVSTLFIRAYKRSDELYTALEARGYDGNLNVIEKNYPSPWAGYAKAVGVNLFLVLLVLVERHYIGGFI